MGRNYSNELLSLPATYEWCRKADVSELTSFLQSSSGKSMTFVGSGGSYAVAAFGAALHELYAERLARAATALDVASSAAARHSSILFITAGGKHADVLGAFKLVAEREPELFGAFCGSRTGPLADLASRYAKASFVSFAFPQGKDGFLATNSVLAFATILLKAYWAAHSLPHELPPFDDIIPEGTSDSIRVMREATASVWERPNVLLLYGPSAAPAALDFESRFHEAGLAAVQLADFRNFAHGRHYWLVRRRSSTSVLALCTASDKDLAERTLAYLPEDVRRAVVSVSTSGPLASIALLLASIHMAGWAGKANGIDPGKPHVPEFGRRIYHMNAWAEREASRGAADVAIWRKSKQSEAVISAKDNNTWSVAHERFVKGLTATNFAGIVLDYDDTVCARLERFTRPSADMAGELNRLLGAGVWLGIATGRGKSVREALRRILMRRYWKRVLVGYYNGAEIAFLADTKAPARSKAKVEGPVATFAEMLTKDEHLSGLIRIDANAVQIKIEPVSPALLKDVIRELQRLIVSAGLPLKVVVSSRSVDVIALATTKRSVVAKIQDLSDGEVLCIGDSGEWPGNDFELLATPHSLSSDATSSDPSTCWNLAPIGVRCASATLAYLKALDASGGTARFRPMGMQQR